MDEATKSEHKQQMSAVIFKGKTVYSKGHNHSSRSVRSINKNFCRWPTSIHAEVDAIIKAKRDLKGMSILIIRVKNNMLKLAKPCRHCLSYLTYVGIKNIYYSNNGNIYKL